MLHSRRHLFLTRTTACLAIRNKKLPNGDAPTGCPGSDGCLRSLDKYIAMDGGTRSKLAKEAELTIEEQRTRRAGPRNTSDW